MGDTDLMKPKRIITEAERERAAAILAATAEQRARVADGDEPRRQGHRGTAAPQGSSETDEWPRGVRP